MKMILKIARTELQTLFYSPIAWLIMIIFAIQTSITFSNILENAVNLQELNHPLSNLTFKIFMNPRNGLYTIVQQYLYLYIPLLTMGLMSREISSGSIKLLYSSPINNLQIILSKYLAMVVYALIIVMILMIYLLYGSFTIDNFDMAAAATGLLGLFLLMCAYAAIGLFMSSLTSYQVVAAIGTLGILALLNMVGNLWQDIALVRDITYWLSIRGRSNEFIVGLICSEDLLYFMIVIALFLSFSVIRLKALRQKSTFGSTYTKYVGVLLLSVALGYISSRPKLMGYIDSTRDKSNTLTKSSQEVLKNIKGNITINTFTNILDKYYYLGLPKVELKDINRFRQYRRFKPEIKIKYHLYYDKTFNPNLDKRYPNLTDRERMLEYARTLRLDSNLFKTPEQIAKIEDLKPEGNRFVRTITAQDGKKTFLRIFDDMQVHPSEAEITAAFKRLSTKLPQVGFLVGHGERSSVRLRDRDYNKFAQEKPFRYSLINQGFDFKEVSLEKSIPDDIDILIIADLRAHLSDSEMENLKEYISGGKNVVIASEPSGEEFNAPILSMLGVSLVPGTLVTKSTDYAPDFIVASPTREGAKMMYQLKMMLNMDYVVTMPGVSAIKYSKEAGYRVTELFTANAKEQIWNEVENKEFNDDSCELNPSKGEEIQNGAPLILALERTINDKEQRILVIGDADCLSNSEISIVRSGLDAANYNFIMGAFYWLSNEEVPIDVRRPAPIDNKLYLKLAGMRITRWSLIGLFPLILLSLYITIWIRRRSH